ncbi:hypothetical protein M407DRAFT_102072 [Tulasnella calospora MUT 4182]|uniref:Uncharacterized protein n=1 Tax=Tulasnella calospora MUT 4182 TaxID=1051891 RepID=A0A0C3QEJ7_9AGAM|nr:hypothetical protein M407DRAFT_102072 [Tulasnella calospora MUT 4182]
MATNVTFSGTSPEECETFLATVHRDALANGKYLDEKWITFYAASLLRGDALVFYENLDAKTKASWAAIRTAFVNRYVRSSQESSGPRYESAW